MTVLNDTGSIPVSRLTLYDIAHRRAVLMSQAATNAGGRGAFVWSESNASR